MRLKSIQSTMAVQPALSPSTGGKVYNRRAHTLPLSGATVNRTKFDQRPRKSIKSLNLYTLAEIFDYLSYADLLNCRLVCSFWKQSIDFHLGTRAHFAYGKTYNNLPNRKGGRNRKKKLPYELVGFATKNLLRNPCEKCLAITENMQQQLASSTVDDQDDDDQEDEEDEETLKHHSKCLSPSCLEISDSDCQSGRTSTCASPMLALANIHSTKQQYYCADCQQMLREFHQQLVLDEDEEATSEVDSGCEDEQEDFYSGYIDDINLERFEHILAKMPRLRALKVAQGYSYGRLRQTCLEVSGVCFIWRIFRLCPLLTRIDLSNCVGLLESDFGQLVELYGKQLVALNVSGCRIDEASLRVIVKGCDRLRYLNVSNNFCRLKGGCFEWLSDSIETVVADYNQNVRVLDGLLQGKGREIIELELNVGFCFNASMPYKLLGTHFQNLISLKIIFKSFGPQKTGTFVHLALLKELEELHLIEEIDDFNSESSLDDESVLAIMQGQGSKLKELHLHVASSLFGGPSSLTDRSISMIDQLCPQLEVFSIKRAAITDVSLNSIGRLKNAHTVHLIDLENISDKGVAQIMSSFKQIEKQEIESVKLSSGVDLNVRQDGPKIEKMKRHCSLSNDMEFAMVV